MKHETFRPALPWAVVVASVTRWLNDFKACGYLQQWRITKVRLTFFRILNKLSKICPRLLKLCQNFTKSGHTDCGSVGRSVVFDTRDARFESCPRIFYNQLYWNDEHKEKEAGNGPFLTRKVSSSSIHKKLTPLCQLLLLFLPMDILMNRLHMDIHSFHSWTLRKVMPTYIGQNNGVQWQYLLNICYQDVYAS